MPTQKNGVESATPTLPVAASRPRQDQDADDQAQQKFR